MNVARGDGRDPARSLGSVHVPRAFALTDLDQVAGCVAAAGAADLVTVSGTQPVATLVPIIWDRTPSRPDAPHGRLLGHLAHANPQWRTASPGCAALAIVHGPQAYISPSWYAAKTEHGRVVPTWNYTAIHFSGPVTFHHDPEQLRGIVTRLTDRHEQHREQPWAVDDAPPDFVAGLLRTIVGFELAVASVTAKEKLSQNRSPADRAGAIAGLRGEPDAGSAAIADLMQPRPPGQN
ncbi:FMN-binding negative transcriptional regulator [Parafrankia sp. BMG5.11]|uniref:FMN-binding negative transcriptional regulator n=1 Tax=Parafrankia sp. BMG5.11 TaxID=222540 RepID=UPI001FB1D00F|nr:FMN-binding negative transcriptional regulator [Parafrankia sp. BMG5.11]